MFNKFIVQDNNAYSWNGKRNYWHELKIPYNKRYSICVYLHYYDKEDKPFYIGQGTLTRAFDVCKSKRRTKAWKNKVKDENLVNVVIYKMDITKAESLKLEKELIYKYSNDNCLVNNRKEISDYSKYSVYNNINRTEIGVFDLNNNLLKVFETLDKAAYEYYTTTTAIKNSIKENKPFRGIVYFKRL